VRVRLAMSAAKVVRRYMTMVGVELDVVVMWV
jgi:hypothetical protein